MDKTLDELKRAQKQKATILYFALVEEFPELCTDEELNGADAVNRLQDIYRRSLAMLGNDNAADLVDVCRDILKMSLKV